MHETACYQGQGILKLVAGAAHSAQHRNRVEEELRGIERDFFARQRRGPFSSSMRSILSSEGRAAGAEQM